MSRSLLHRFAWLAVCAMLGLALVPSVSHALSSDVGEPWSQICSASGSRASVSTPSQAPADEAAMQGHCPLCMPQSQTLGMPPGPATLHPAAAGPCAAVEMRALRGPHLHSDWVRAPARAPPGAA